ncbi:transporter [uncultured Alistipes sp.]|uniref:OmpP1/FadL family transporter n=1 Tax=uncultured Alistipes sp. TaxID=538949 RepID=UPI00260C02CB|nr:transporter [uncultured Alistipes sp.]
MKRSVIILLAAAAALAALPSQAQQAGSLQFGGAVLNRDIQMPADLAQLSQTHAFGTARAMGMGGAFVSLGADLTSMTLNPAGLGMYRRNEITLTPLVSLSSASTGGTSEWLDNSRSRFSLANLGVALNLYENPKRGLVSLTLGIGVNRVADFNTRYSFSSESRYDSGTGQLMPTIADIFGQQLGQAGIWPAANGSLGYNADPAFWPAILGYNGYMLNVENNGREDLWVPSYIGHNASVGHSMDVVHSGSINEFSLSVGGNVNNIVYFGASLGVQSVRRTSRVTYQEEYLYPGSDGVALDRDGRPLEAQLDYASLQQRQTLSGAGVNFKLGVTVRPVAGLRLGAAFHTPTYYSLSQLYRGDIETYGRNNTTHEGQESFDSTPVQRDEGSSSWNFTSPARLLLGASYTFGRFAIVSVDYERAWYNGMRVKNLPDVGMSRDFYKADFKRNFCATNTLRAGIEVRPVPFVALRAGAGYTGSMFRDREAQINSPAVYETRYFTAGAGVNLSRTTTLDVAYQWVDQKQTSYELFFSYDPDAEAMFTHSGLYDTSIVRHYIALSLAFRF